MNEAQIISDLILNRENTLSVKRITVVKTKGSLANPQISVGTLPFYEWSKEKNLTFVITYGRYLNCELLVYKTWRKDDGDFFETSDQKEAVKHLKSILKSIVN